MNIKKLLQSVGIGLGAILLSASIAYAANNIFQNGSNVGIGTTTPGATLGIAGNILASSTATSTFQGNGINITAGCFALNGGCVGGSGGSGTVTSVAMTTPTGLTVSGSPITTSGTLGLTLTSGYNIPLTASTTNWDTLYHASTSLPYQAQGNYITALTGDVTASGPGSVAATLATVNTNTGSWGSSTAIPNFTVNGKGLITAAGTNVVIAPAGTLSGTTLNSTVVTSSLTSANLANLTAANSTLTFSGSYNGNTARTVGLNLGNANTWSALQTFGGTQNCVIGDNGSSGSLTCTDGAGNSVSFTAANKALQVTGQSTFTALTVTDATSTNATSTNAVVSGNDRLSYITGSAQCLHVDTNGFITGTGSDCSSSQWTTSGSNIYYNTGNVGIGTNLPGNALDVEGTFTSNSAIKIGSLRIQPYGLNNGFIEENTLFNGSDFVYNQTGQAGLFYFAGNEGQFRFANSGSAGASTGLATIAQLKINADGTFAVGASVSNAAGNYTGAKFIVNASGNVGIGTTSPFAALSVIGSSIPEFAVASSTTAGSANPTFEIDQNGHIITSGPKPVITGGTSSVVGNDTNGTITIAGTALTSVTLTFAKSYGTAPVCTESDNSTSLTADVSSVSATQVVFGFSIGINSGTLWYHCEGTQ